eukprot:12894948-Prorocentrum_lima.AAC.1
MARFRESRRGHPALKNRMPFAGPIRDRPLLALTLMLGEAGKRASVWAHCSSHCLRATPRVAGY